MKNLALVALLITCSAFALTLGPSETSGWDSVVLNLRLPRVLAAVVAGAGLALAGICMQAVLRNPLADPYILGLSSGASLGAVASLVVLSIVPTAVAASVGALVASLIVFGIARDESGLLPPTRLILAGVSVAAVLSSVTAFLLQVAPNETTVRAALYFSSGTFGGVRMQHIVGAFLVVSLAFFGVWKAAWSMDRLLLGEDVAESLGVNTRRLRQALLLGSSVLTGSLIALAGPVGFIGLAAPHLARLFVGPTHRALAPVAAVLGGLIVLFADTLGRTAFTPREVPAGLLTAVFGGPFFLAILARRDYGFGVGQ